MSQAPTEEQSECTDHAYDRIISLDGGPSAMLAVRLLRYVEQNRPGFLARANVFSGVSFGSYLSLFLASRLRNAPANDPGYGLRVINECVDYANSLLGAFHLGIFEMLRMASGLRAAVGAKQLEQVLAQYLGSVRLGDLGDKRVVIIAFNKTRYRPRVFDNFLMQMQPQAADYKLVDIAMASSAFPVLVPIHVSPIDGNEYLDGALVTNNTSAAAISRTASARGRSLEPPEESWKYLQHVIALSFGSSGPTDTWNPLALKSLLMSRLAGMGRTSIDWGWLQWMLHEPFRTTDLMYQGGLEEVDYESKELLGVRYHRTDPQMGLILNASHLMLPTRWMVDNLDRQAANLYANGFLTPTLSWLDAFWGEDEDVPSVPVSMQPMPMSTHKPKLAVE